MADNRMYLVCTQCQPEKKWTSYKGVFALAKFFCSTGWYPAYHDDKETDYTNDLNNFLEEHSYHESISEIDSKNFSQNFRIDYETEDGVAEVL